MFQVQLHVTQVSHVGYVAPGIRKPTESYHLRLSENTINVACVDVLVLSVFVNDNYTIHVASDYAEPGYRIRGTLGWVEYYDCFEKPA